MINTLLNNDEQTEVEEMLSLQTRLRDILRVEGVAVPGLVQTVDALLPPGPVQLAGQVVPWVIRPPAKYFKSRKNSKTMKYFQLKTIFLRLT